MIGLKGLRPNYPKLGLVLLLAGLCSCQALPGTSSSSTAEVWTGFIEGETVDVSAQTGGRLTTLAVQEGDRVQANQPLATLDDELVQRQIEMADANIAAADAQVQLLEAGARPEDVRKAEARVEQARAALDAANQAAGDAEALRANPQSLLVLKAQAEARAQAAAQQFDAAVKQAQAADVEHQFWQEQISMVEGGVEITLPDGTTRHFGVPSARMTFLTSQSNEAGHAAWEAWGAVTTAQANKDAAAAALQDIEDQLSNPLALDANVDQASGARDRAAANLQSAQAALQVLRDGASPAQIQAARAAAAQARAARASLDQELAHYKIAAPRAGTVTQVFYRVGEVVPPAAPLVRLSVAGDLTLRVFVPMSQLDQIHLGAVRTIWLPDLNNRTSSATVTNIADQAEFTARQAQTDSERNAQLVAVELKLQNPDSAVKAGMPASVSFGSQTPIISSQAALVGDQPNPTFSSTLEARETRIASEVEGQVLAVRFSQGQTVKVGDALVDLDDRAIKDSANEADAAVRAAQANLDQVQEKARPGTIAQAQAGVAQAQADLDAAQRAAEDAQRALDSPQDLLSQVHAWEGKTNAAQGDVTGAQAALSNLQNQIQLAQNDQSMAGKARLAALQKQAEAAQANLDAARITMKGSQQVQQLYQQILENPLELITAQHTAASQVEVAAAGLKVAQADLDIAQRGPQPEAVALAEAKLRATQANLQLVQAQAKRFVLASPLSGVVLTRDAEPGETARAGAPLLTIADLRELQMTVYVPIRELGVVHVGQAASLRLPSLPGQTFACKIDYIASEAEFKPANIYNSQERSELVFQVRVKVDNSNGELKAGLPADVTFQ
jgi:membrane fusion protein YbhG